MRITALAIVASLTLGCSYFQKPETQQKRYKYQDEAGSVLIGVQSVAPFEAYIDALQPRFNLTAEEALRTAVATTQIKELRELRALLLSIAVNLPTQTTAISEETKRVNDLITSSRTETSTEASGTVPATTVPTQITDAIAQLSDTSTSISFDASLNYRAAAALMQEVALLSNYVRDAAVGGRTIPYVVRMLLTVFPSARNSPYDVYTHISFFGNEDADDIGGALGPLLYNRGIILSKEAQKDLRGIYCNGDPLPVIPLFVTDNLETSILRSARATKADVGGSLGGNIGGAGVGGAGRVQNESSASALGKGVNALFTLGVASENTLAVRLGAVTYDTGYEMLPRTYNLTALVLMPSVSIAEAVAREKGTISIEKEFEDVSRNAAFKELQGLDVGIGDILVPCTSGSFSAQSMFRDALRGKFLKSRNMEKFVKELAKQGLTNPALVTAVIRDDYHSFKQAYVREFRDNPTSNQCDHAWTVAVAARSRRGITGGRFEIPRTLVRFFAIEEGKKVAIYDDGKISSIQLSGATGIVSKGLRGQLTAKGGDKTWTVHSTNAVATSDGTGARFEFPSLQQAAKAASLELKDIEVSVEALYSPPVRQWFPDQSADLVWYQVKSPIVTIDQKVTPTAFSLVLSSLHIRANADGVGQIKLEVRATDKKNPVPEIRFAVDGGVVTNIIPAEKADTGADLVLLTNKIYMVTIGNLLPGNSLKLKAWRMDGDTKIEIPAIPVAVYEQEGSSPKGRE